MNRTSSGPLDLSPRTPTMSRSLSLGNFKSVFPSFSLHKGGKKCMSANWQASASLSATREPGISVYNTGSNNRYFKYRNFVTPNNLDHPEVLSTFLHATASIQDRIDSQPHSFEARGNDIEITIIVRCISSNPKISYYIADHAQRTIRWLGSDVPKCYNANIDIRMRECAEYWHHRSKFPVHRHCTQNDRTDVAELLDGMLVRSRDDPYLDRGEIEQHIRKLDNIPLLPPLTDHQTSVLATVHSEALKHSLPGFYSLHPSLKSKLCQSLFGRSFQRFTHNHTHMNPSIVVPRVMQSHVQRQRQSITSPHSSEDTGGMVPGSYPH
ncbi:hypothetical protein RSOLAG1IB_05745 [Rhizoctonia solani AG-1 IB]|uniref:Uncharacterized protein n=1 Tax=Thanatephorus cucumeris (strain AG1-IB / isolate 7/3/14) TaxID=1108050 RepID=A0A0B7F3A7_THACB|nr:hypothetical protein RSOLAG1IB_05745 [Rhizoctonia solani AG-1 IB]